MLIKTQGDTLTFSFVPDITIISGTGTLTVYDSSGTVRYGSRVYDNTDGTYTATLSSSGYPNGVLTEKWAFKGGYGTTTAQKQDSYRIVGTDIVTPYITAGELGLYYENIDDFLDGQEDFYVQDAYFLVNTRLNALGYEIPFIPKSDGYYDQPLRDLNAYEAIFKMVSKRQSSYNRSGNEKPWFYAFKDFAEALYKNLEKKAYNFTREIGAGDSGIGIPHKIVGTSAGQMDNNWRGGASSAYTLANYTYNSGTMDLNYPWLNQMGGQIGFTDSSFSRDWIITIVGTGTSGKADECQFTWSNDGGMSDCGTRTTSFNWQELINGVLIRFYQGTSTSGSNLFAVGDKWTFNTSPRAQSAGGKNTAKSY